MTAPPPGDENKSIKAAETTFSILELLSERGACRLTDIATELGYSKSTMHYYLKTLERKRYVVEADGQYHLGLRLLHLGGSSLSRFGAYRVAVESANDLSSQTGELAQVVLEEEGMGYFVYQSHGDDDFDAPFHIGDERPLHSNAYGKAILAFLSRESVLDVIDRHGLERYTDRTITDPDALFAELEKIRERRLAFDDQEQYDGVRSVASPILLDDSQPVGALGVTGGIDIDTIYRNDRMKARRFANEAPEVVRRTAHLIGNTLSERGVQ